MRYAANGFGGCGGGYGDYGDYGDYGGFGVDVSNIRQRCRYDGASPCFDAFCKSKGVPYLGFWPVSDPELNAYMAHCLVGGGRPAIGFRPQRRFGGSRGRSLSGFGEDRAKALGFSASAVWADVQLGGSCYTPSSLNYKNPAMSGQCNAAGGRATKLVQAALNELGFNPGPPAGFFNEQTKSAGQAFAATMGMSYGGGLAPSKDVLVAMEDQLRQGKTPGPSTVTKYKKVGGTFVKDDDKGVLAGMSTTTTILLIAAAAGLGYVAYKGAKKRRGSTSTSTSRAMVLRR
jgi:hypothetical protein